MFDCPLCGVALVKARGGIERVGTGFDVTIMYYQEMICPVCKMRVKFRGAVLQLGGGTKNVVDEEIRV